MTVDGMIKLLNAELLATTENACTRVAYACGADLMSDVLAYANDNAVLLTGLVNVQVIRTAEMMDMCCVIFVRGKKPTEEMIKLAKERDLVLLSTDYPMFEACGKLYAHGLKGGGAV